MKKVRCSLFIIIFVYILVFLPFYCVSPCYAGGITVTEPRWGETVNNYLNVRGTVDTTGIREVMGGVIKPGMTARERLDQNNPVKIRKVEVYFAVGDEQYSKTPIASQSLNLDKDFLKAGTESSKNPPGKTDFFISINIENIKDTDKGKIKVVAKDINNRVIVSTEVKNIKKKSTHTDIHNLKDGSWVIKDESGKSKGVRFVLWSKNAEKVQVWIYGDKDTGEPVKIVDLIRQKEENLGGYYWTADVLNEDGMGMGEKQSLCFGNGTHYGYRVWGNNWKYDEDWRPGTEKGFEADVDSFGNRFNPNKLLIDPYARTISKDPDWSKGKFVSGEYRNQDTGLASSKSIVYDPSSYSWDEDVSPRIPGEDTIIYEVHVRGFTQNGNSAVVYKGTYRGLAEKVNYLKELGITSVELLPIFETENDGNDLDPHSEKGDNYWGYMTINYFSPDRRYSSDKSPTGPINEFKDMVKVLHKNKIEVILDVVYNHTSEGDVWHGKKDTSTIQSFRGIDNQIYYELCSDNQYFWSNTGCGANFNVANPKVTQFVLDSLHYWVDEMHVDGFRFDLASVLGNTKERDGFRYDRVNSKLINRILKEFPHTKIIAEPWGIGDGTYQIGNFPGDSIHAWSDWNDHFRDTVRRVVRGDKGFIKDLTLRIKGSPDLFGERPHSPAKRPYNSINFITCHDGFTLMDLVSYNTKVNNQPYPYGESDGGTDNHLSWDCTGDAVLQKQQIRNFATLLLLSAGTPMILGGDEMGRTQKGNNNAYNLDTIASWYDWTLIEKNKDILDYFKFVIRLRQNHNVFRRREFFTQKDNDGDGIADIQWHGREYLSPDFSSSSHTLAWRLDGNRLETLSDQDDNDFYIIANFSPKSTEFQLPPNNPGTKWYAITDTVNPCISEAIGGKSLSSVPVSDGSWTSTHDHYFQANHTYLYKTEPRSITILIQR